MTDTTNQRNDQNNVFAALSGVLRAARRLDRRVVLSGILAFVLALLLLALIFVGPAEARFGTAVGLFGLLIGLQLVILFFRPTDRSALGLARRAFAEGQFDEAVQQLEILVTTTGSVARKPDPRVLILLGNSYRQLGRLVDSETQLTQVLQLSSRQPSALYGMGRTIMAQGNFEAAANWFDQALVAGAPSVIGCELGLAELLAGNKAEAIKMLQKMTRRLQIETYRAWLANSLLLINTIDMSQALTVASMISARKSTTVATLRANISQNAEGRAYWQAEAIRFHGTVYGQHLDTILHQTGEFLLMLEEPGLER